MIERDATIGFIGAGVLGKGLALALAQHGYKVAASSSRRLESAQWLADRIPGCHAYATGQELADAVDLVFITTPDSAISQVAGSVVWRAGQAVVHCCGAASSELLGSAADSGALTGAFHPFQTFAGLDTPEETVQRLSGVTFALAGDGWLPDYLSRLAYDLGGHPVSIADADRPLYHASAVMVCGYMVALMQAAAELWEEIGFSPEEAIKALYPLSLATVENVGRSGLVGAVTGPVPRGDTETIRAHLESLFLRAPDLVPLYSSLVRASLPLGARRGVGPDGLLAIEELIDHYSSAG